MSYQIPLYVHHRQVHGEVVLLDTRTEAYLGLGPTGATIWLALANGESLDSAVAAVTDRFEVEPDVARDDVVAFVELLEVRGLVCRVEA